MTFYIVMIEGMSKIINDSALSNIADIYKETADKLLFKIR